MISGVGVDILHLPRLVALVHRRGMVALAKRILHPDEQNAFDQTKQEHRVRFLAVRYLEQLCGKESIILN